MKERRGTMVSVEETAVICAYMKYGRLGERLRHPQPGPEHSASSLSQVASNLLPAFLLLPSVSCDELCRWSVASPHRCFYLRRR